MPSLSNATLFRRLRAALPATTVFHTPENVIHPALFSIVGIGRIRAYLFTVTPDRSAPGARPAGEFKIQLIVEGQARGARAALEMVDAYTVLLGYSPDFGVFVAWEAKLHTSFAFSANVQVREPLLIEARDSGWAIAEPRPMKGALEVRAAFTPGNLVIFLRASREADNKSITGKWREAFLLSKAPHYKTAALPQRGRDVEAYVERERQRLSTTRLIRNAKFGPRVKEQYDYSCAVCAVQLEIVEAAHIIPVNDPKSSDDVWNGLALCPNHHTLFDARRFIVRPNLAVQLDSEALNFLEESGRASGIELLSRYAGKTVAEPSFWNLSPNLRDRMVGALAYVCGLTFIAQD